MHRGVREFIRWVEAHRDHTEIQLERPASAGELAGLEQQLGGPLPADLRFVLTRFNGARLPSGRLLSAGLGPGTIEAAVRDFAARMEADFLDPELLLPFHESEEGSLLAFDRSAGPVADTWPIVDYFPDLGELRLVHRTFDGWCEACLSEWSADDFYEAFSLDKYLLQGERHAAVEPDVASAHATVAHARKRAGQPELALASYLAGARCVPTIPWCDWEALKIAALLDRPAEALEAATRLSAPAPRARWRERETTPGRVADIIARFAIRAKDPQPWNRLLDLLLAEADPSEEPHVREVVRRAKSGEPLPPTIPVRPSVVAPLPDEEAWWNAIERGYLAGQVRDEDLLLDPELRPLRMRRSFATLLTMRRDF